MPYVQGKEECHPFSNEQYLNLSKQWQLLNFLIFKFLIDEYSNVWMFGVDDGEFFWSESWMKLFGCVLIPDCLKQFG